MWTTVERNAMLDGGATRSAFHSLHSAYPGLTGANEIAGGAPPYARKATAYGVAAGGQRTVTGSTVFDVPGGGTVVAWLGAWDLIVAGVFASAAPLGGGTPVPFTAEDSTDFLTADQHGLTNGQQVVVWDTEGAVVPTGLVEGTIYFVVGATTDTLQLSLTSGGAAIDLTSDGGGFVQTIVPEIFGAQGTYTLNSIVDSLNR